MMYPILLKQYPVHTGTAFHNIGKPIRINMLRNCTDKYNEIKLPPEPTTCCMSGCANCVWLNYAESLIKLLNGNSDKAFEIVLQKIRDPNLKAFLSMELRFMQNKFKQASENRLTSVTNKNTKSGNDDNDSDSKDS